GCQPPSTNCGTPSGLAATNITQTSATLGWAAVSGATSYNLQWKLGSSSTWTTVSGLTTTSYALSGLSASTTYNYQVQAVCSAGAGNYSAAASFTTQSSGGGGCTDVYEANESRTAAKSITPGTAITAKISSTTDKDYFKFNNTSAARNVKVELTGLPADYDLKLYRSSTLVRTSENAGTADEVVIYNNTQAVTTYTAYVYGYNGAYDNSVCYNLLATISSGAFRTDGSTDGQTQQIEIPVVFENAGFGLFPNPANQQVTVEVPMENEADVTVSIMDPAGKVAAQQSRTLSKGDNRMQFDLNTLARGIYFVQVRNGQEMHTRKLVVSQ
ncbi:MAG TPA: T9SS type A sorting domain-containing protein, partial [Saprospiraceae bacterium]|nr:T9SS type A sorting domain-containing protein [Saprospiraceae bacterium]